MKCPRCGADNVDGTLTCKECGTNLALAELEVDREVEELLDALPTNVALREAEEAATRRFEELKATMQEENEAEGADASDGGEEPAAKAEDAPDSASVEDDEADDEVDADDASEAGTEVAPPPEKTEQHFVVRNTRDYDHDAQSVNLASSVENFDTIKQDKSSRGGIWRDPYARAERRGLVPGEGNSRSKLRPLLAIFLVALVLGGGGAVLSYGMELWGGKTIPSLLGESQATAEQKLIEKGLLVRIENVPADDAIGKVLVQSPEAGERVPEGSEVMLGIAVARYVPEVIGLTEADARLQLEAAGAQHISVVSVPSKEWDGTVIGVTPNPGQVFTSRDEVIVTVAGQFFVPDVVGKKETDAVQIVEAAGLQAHVNYVSSDRTVRTVVETIPPAGQVVYSDSVVEIQVSSPYPSSPTHLAEYFAHSSRDIDSYLQQEGFSLDAGFLDTNENAVAVYTSEDKGNVTFSSQPYATRLSLPREGSSNVLASGAAIAGVRMDLPADLVPDGFEPEDLQELMEVCGFENMVDMCDNKVIKLPAGSLHTSTQFACGSGNMGNVVWTVLIVNTGNGRRACATCAKDGLYPESDMQPFGGQLSAYMAYQEVYKGASANQPTHTNSSNAQSTPKEQEGAQYGTADEQQ